MQIDEIRFLGALAKAAKQVSAEKLFLTNSFDAPIYPEALVQVVVAQSLSRELHLSRIELEFPTAELERDLCGGTVSVCSRTGWIDIACWQASTPLAIVEVKDQLTGSDDGLMKDCIRIQEFLSIQHRLLPSYRLSFGGLVAYIGKCSDAYKEPRPFDHELKPLADRSIATVKRNICDWVDEEKFTIAFRHGRCIDSSRDASIADPYVGTEYEESLTGSEQMTNYLVAIVTRNSDG